MLPRIGCLAGALALGVVSSAVLPGQRPSDAGLEHYEKRVRPLLADHCYHCHGAGRQRSELRLDSRASILAGGTRGPAVVPGDPDASLLIQAVRRTHVDLRMPPKRRLPERLVTELEAWVAMGAPGPEDRPARRGFDLEARRREQWAFQPVRDPTPPAVRGAWPSGDLDRFVLARLNAAGLHPAPRATPNVLVRRAFFDTIGLPPSPTDVEELLRGDLAAGWPALVDRLLASPHFGEAWGRHWLDVVRYAESRGHEYDFTIPNAWQYRDFVIRALNADVPYDQFVAEHVAGDLLPEPRRHPERGFNESVLGTGVWYLGEEVHSPVDTRLDEAERIDNKVDVFSKAFLGLTVACARCHDHKFDPISARDYYGLSGYFLSSGYRQVRFESMPGNADVAQALDEHERWEGRPLVRAMADAMQSGAAQADAYLGAALAVLRAGPHPAAAAGARAGSMAVVFEDFESTPLEGWQVAGTAFGRAGQVAVAELPEHLLVAEAVGAGLAHSHGAVPRGTSRERDRHVGTLTSPEFTVEHDFIHFLIGGGKHPRLACVNLVVDGVVVRTATGENAVELKPARFDVRPWRGRRARLQVVDRVHGAWGHVGVDHIVFSDDADGSSFRAILRRPQEAAAWFVRAAEIAARRGLDAPRLAQWVDEVQRADASPAHPLHAFALLAERGRRRAVDALRPMTTPATGAAADADVVLDYAGVQPEQWIQDGVAFGAGPVQIGAPKFTNDVGTPIGGVQVVGAARSDPVWDALSLDPEAEKESAKIPWVQSGRTLRTPTFVLREPKLLYRVAGSGHALVLVDSHRMLSNPLHLETLKSWYGEREFQWIEHDLEPYVGHRVWIEFTPGARETGGGPFAVAMVAQGREPPPEPATHWPGIASEAAARGEAAVATAFRDRLVAALDRFGAATLHAAPDAAELSAWVDWLVRRRNLVVTEDTAWGRVAAAGRAFARRRAELTASIERFSSTAPAMLDGSGVDEHVLVRGNHRALGGVVPRRNLEALGGTAVGSASGSGRLELARQLTAGDNPLVARVLVNRVWQHLLGRGLVASVDNFGALGEPCSHPELLDWLTSRFVAEGWSIKNLIRRILLSETYRMSATVDPASVETDPQNVLLHRHPPRRLPAEMLRDAILTVSGRLDPTPFGPSVPVHLTEFVQGRGRPDSGPLDGDGRRSVYLAVRRNFLSPFFLAFDFPIPFTSRGRRGSTNVPGQALALLNDPFVREQAGVWAERLLHEHEGDATRLREAYLRAFARSPSAAEQRAGLDFLAERRQLGEGDDVAVWADLCHVLFNVKEFSYVW
ncbi:MAG: PSD1 and planctomycete cytochrome C domain-containing protein [Planctomycetota bacterium]